jgi:uncharacterized protein (TIGR00369 family)
MKESDEHFRKLERMYLSAPVNIEIYKGITIQVSSEKATLELPIDPRYFHAANAIHGSVYFKMLDDAAFFAVNSIVQNVFVYTVSFNTQLLRPINKGIVKAVGEVKFKSANLFIADAVLYDENDKMVGRGTGNFMKSRIVLSDEIGYK